MAKSLPILRALGDGEDPGWDAYVNAHSEGSFFHLLPWRGLLADTLGSEPHYLWAERDGRIVGLLPAFVSGRAPFASALVSIPVGVGGGILADDQEVATLLRDGARAYAELRGLAYVEYKSEFARFPDLRTKDSLYFTFKSEILADRESQLKALPRKTRATIRAAQKSGLTYAYNRSDLDVFYDYYALSLRNLGTPIWPKRFFSGLLERFPGQTNLLTVRQGGRVLGVVLNFYHQRVMLPFFAGSAPDARDVSVNNFMYWAMLESGYDLGYRTFDFGRSKVGTGPFRFKRAFGFEPTPLHYQYDLIGQEAMPEVNPNNARYQKVIALWRRMPVSVTKIVGPFLQRRLP